MGSKRALILFTLLALSRAESLRAQCPDGSPPPCSRPGDRTPARTLDPNRLAVLPFRTTGADPALAHLSTGLVDLLSAELNGAIGPAAVDPGEALREWDRSGSGRAPATQAAAVRVARTLGAGQVAYSSVVGNSRRFTVTMSVLEVPSGSPLVARVQIEGTADSLSSLVSRLATQLVGRTLGAVSASDEALREYNAGMLIYRNINVSGNGGETAARAHFEKALTLDSTFVLPAFRLIMLRTLFGPSGPIKAVALRTAWNQRQKLSVEQRVLVESLTDSTRMLFRMQMLPRLERAIAATPKSPEAWDILGDLYFHVGALIGREKPFDKAKQALHRALELDARITVSARPHLADIAFLENDAKAFNRFAALVAREGELATNVSWNRYRSALLFGNARSIRTTQRDVARDFVLSLTPPPWFLGITLPPGELDSMMSTARAVATTDAQRALVAQWSARSAVIQGRPEEARKYSIINKADSVAVALAQLEAADQTESTLKFLGDQIGKAIPQGDDFVCEFALARLRHGDTTGVAALLGNLPRLDPALDFGEIRPGPETGQPNNARSESARTTSTNRRLAICAEVLSGVLASEQQRNSRLLQRADSLMQFMPLNCCDWWNYDIALSFARRAEYGAALRAVRRRWMIPGGASVRVASPLRSEGRWAALAGDTSGAIKAYREYLKWRDKPEPLHIPQRDSVRAELSALERGRRR